MLSQLGQTLLPSYLTIIKKPTTAEVLVLTTTTTSTTTNVDDVTDIMRGMNSVFFSLDNNNNESSGNSNRSFDDVDDGIDNLSLAWNKTSSSLLKQLFRVGVVIGFINLTLCQLLRRYFYKV